MEQVYRILIAEDTPSDIYLEEREIKKTFSKYELKIVDTREEFLAALTEFQPHIILSDYRMPTFDGLTALKLTLEKAPWIPFILVTGSVNEETAVECMKAGAMDYILKERIRRLGPAMIHSLEQSKNKQDKAIAEDLLKESEEMYRLMFAGNPQPMLIFDLETLNILEINEAASLLYGYSKEEFLTMTIKDIRPASELNILFTRLKNLNNNYSHLEEVKHLKKNGEIIFVEILSQHINFNNRPARHVMVNNITDRKRVEEALRLNEEKYRTFFENVQDVFYVIDMDGIVQDISPSVKYFSEFLPEEIIGNPVANLYYNTVDRELFLSVLLNSEEVRDFEVRLKTKTGDIKYVSLNARLIYDKFGKPQHIEGALRDITERKKAEEELLRSEERFRSIFENNLSVMLLIDPESGKIIDANNAAENYYGWTRQQLVNMSIHDINVLGKRVNLDLEKARTHKQVHFEFKHRRANGLICDVEIFSSMIEIQGKEYLHSIIHDITTRKEAEKLVQLLSKAIEQSPVSLMITDKDANLVYVNPKFTEITGYTFDEVIGKNPRFLKSGEHSIAFYQILWNTILAGEVWHGEFRNKRKNGQLYWDKSVITSLTDNKGEITYYIAVQEDITKLKKLNEEFVRAKEKAEESDKLKTAFLHTISHEIRTPINAIVGFSDFITNPDLTSEKRRQFVDIITKSSHQLLSIFTDIVNMATIEAGQVFIEEKKTNINMVCGQIYEQYLNSANEKKLQLNFSVGLPNTESDVITDEFKLMQILSNLVGNAIKFTLTGFVYFGYNKRDNYLEFYIKDSGIGIAKKLEKEIFQRFRQADYSHTRKFGGSGLGLSISKAYVEMMGGNIWLKSELDKGTEFYFTIPFKSNENINEPEFVNVDNNIYRGPKKVILVVEDEECNFLLVEEILKVSDFILIHAENGMKAIEWCKKRNDIDLILMDIKMPVMGGYEATKKIREFYRNIPIIAQTAYIQDYDRSRAKECGINDYISKPFKVHHLMQIVNKYIATK